MVDIGIWASLALFGTAFSVWRIETMRLAYVRTGDLYEFMVFGLLTGIAFTFFVLRVHELIKSKLSS